MEYVIIYIRGAYRIHRSSCSDVKKDRLAGIDSWVANGSLKDIMAEEIRTLADDGVEIDTSEFHILPCAKEGRNEDSN